MVKEKPINVFSASFGMREGLPMAAVMAALVNGGFEFSVIDDRGGSNSWIIKLQPTTASKNILPKLLGVDWLENRELAIPV